MDFELNNILITGEQDADTKTMNITEEAKEEPNPVVEAQEIKNAAEEELPPEKVIEVVEEEPLPEKVTEIVKEEKPNPVVEAQEIKSVVEEEPPPENVVEIIKEEKPNPVYARRVPEQVVTEEIHEKKDELRDISKSENNSQKVTQSIANQYIRKNFDYINKLIRLNISYPGRARKMSMEGNVIVTFVVRLDGSIKDVFIKKSSGYSILDNNVIKAVKKAAPFPPPPVEAKIIIPITYRLDA
ncbi:MAG: energy transducer TonB [Planctomycetota bacterium]